MPVYENTQIINEQEITIAIEVDKLPPEPGPYENLRDIKGLEKARDLFGDGLELAKNCATRVVNSIKEMGGTAKPDEFQLQFSIKLDTEVGALIAKSSTEAQLQVTMTWKTDEEKQK
ncbi:MAG: hypothetical protein H6655_12660 [Ardenticatenaceae bacterium]|nr:hypothetical protein [Ardenticatenaceae bacterium]